jgi:hypothetical protein
MCIEGQSCRICSAETAVTRADGIQSGFGNSASTDRGIKNNQGWD